MSFLKKKAKALRLLPSFYAHIRIQRHNAWQIGQSGAWGSGRQWGSAFPCPTEGLPGRRRRHRRAGQERVRRA